MNKPEIDFSRSAWRDAFDLLDYVDARSKQQWAMSLLIAVWCLVMVAVTASQRINAVPLLWGGAFLFWLCVAVWIAKASKHVEDALHWQRQARREAKPQLWPEVHDEASS